MADVGDFTTWSSTASSNNPQGGTAIGTGLDDNLREIQAQVAKWRDGTGHGILTVITPAGANTITGTTSPAPTLAANQKYLLLPAGTNTGAVTLALNSGAAKNVYAGNSALVGGELHANIPLVLEYDGTQFQLLGPVFRQQTRQVLTSGTGATYTTPTGATRINVRMVGGGGGGGAQTTNDGAAGTDTTFGTLTAAKGSGGSKGTVGTAGAGGAGTNGDINITGAAGNPGQSNPGATITPAGGSGGASFFGGAGGGNSGAAATNSGSGGGGAAGSTSPASSAGGGGAGAYVEKLITAPAATYTYTVGAKGAGGAAGVTAGGNGADGIIVVDEFYN